MESLRWRYLPEFLVRVQIDGALPDESVRLAAVSTTARCFSNYGVKILASPGAVLCSVREHHDGTNWTPAVSLTTPCVFAFSLEMPVSVTAGLQYFGSGTMRFGRRMLYVNNLTGAGLIDANVVGDEVVLTIGNSVASADSASAVTPVFSTTLSPGEFSEFQAAKIEAGSATAFSIVESIPATQDSVSYDFSGHEAGSYVWRLEGAAPIEEPVFVDRQVAGSEAVGVVEIFRDVWHSPPVPRVYSVNFLSNP